MMPAGMDAKKPKWGYHVMAVATVAVWGTTFVSTKVLVQCGLMPAEIFFYRFLLAYLCLWAISYRKLWADSRKDEFLFLLAGLCGGSLYFLTENTALSITLASNVSLIVCVAPLLTTVLFALFKKEEPFTRRLLFGSLVALAGVGLVVLNGSRVLKITPVGDFLSFAAALTWAFYSLVIKQLDNRYSVVFVTRKVFFYGVATILPFFLFHPLRADMGFMRQPAVWGNLLFLGFVASMLCFVSWNKCVKELGAVRCTNYIYLGPLVTLFASAVAIHEQITGTALAGCALILSGIYMTGRKKGTGPGGKLKWEKR